MTALAESGGKRRQGVADSNAARSLWLLVAIGALVLVILTSIAVGSRDIPISTVLDAIFAYDDSDDHAIIMALRVPRTALGIVVAMALGVSGALIQALARNPLADPGIWE